MHRSMMLPEVLCKFALVARHRRCLIWIPKSPPPSRSERSLLSDELVFTYGLYVYRFIGATPRSKVERKTSRRSRLLFISKVQSAWTYPTRDRVHSGYRAGKMVRAIETTFKINRLWASSSPPLGTPPSLGGAPNNLACVRGRSVW
jgi:hypothetical protein